MGSIVGNVREIGTAVGGYLGYYLNKPISDKAYISVLGLHCKTNGRFTDRMKGLLGMLRPPRTSVKRQGLLGTFQPEDQKKIAASIAQNGFYVFENRLPSEICDQIEELARQTPATVYGVSKGPSDRYIFDESKPPIGKKYAVPDEITVQNPAIQQLMGDQSLSAIAEAYLGTLPTLSDVNLWWSTPHPGSADEDAGQNYHFDFDTAPRWLMIFIYLTDVDENNGPHMYVRGSHRSGLPQAEPLRARGYVRIPDQEIVDAFGQDAIVELKGKRGTVLAVDTIGFHKGKSLLSGHRLMAQLIYSFAHFSGERRRHFALGPNVHVSLAEAKKAAPRIYGRFD